MKAQLIFLSLLVSGCGANKNVTLFLKEQDMKLVSLKGTNCVESGHVITKMDNSYRMTTSYFNCDVFLKRKMEPFEPHQWGYQELEEGYRGK